MPCVLLFTAPGSALESLFGETFCRQVKFLCCARWVKDSKERGLRRAQRGRAGARGGETPGLFVEMRTGFCLRRGSPGEQADLLP